MPVAAINSKSGLLIISLSPAIRFLKTAWFRSATWLLLAWSVVCLSLLAQTPPATTDNPSLIRLTVSNGDQLSGKAVEVTAEHLVLETSWAGRLTIRAPEIKTWQTDDPELRTRLNAVLPKDKSLFPDASALAKETAKETQAANTPTNTAGQRKGKKGAEPVIAVPPPKPNLWEQAVNFAWTMSRGNANVSDLSVAFGATRKQGSHRLAFNSFGRYGITNGRESASLLTSSLRYERTVGKLPAFTESLFEIDRIKHLDYRFTENIGLTYPVVKGDDGQLSVDFGTGFTRENFDRGVERIAASGMLRLKASQKLSEKTLFSQQATLFSTLNDPGTYRVQAEASLTTPINRNLALRVSGINRFDARPQGLAKPNDFTLLTGFTFKF